jgi:hypothetical protein
MVYSEGWGQAEAVSEEDVQESGHGSDAGGIGGGTVAERV